MSHQISVMVHTPAHSGIGGALTYESDVAHAAGTLVRVPLGSRELLGVVWDSHANQTISPPSDMQLRTIASVLHGVPPLSAHWRQLVQFAASYYQRSAGEVALAALPSQLRDLTAEQWARRLKRKPKAAASYEGAKPAIPTPTDEQTQVLADIDMYGGPFLLFGNTGSGKTEVYLRAAQAVLARDPHAQILVMVPEINLTPQLEARFRARFCPQWGADCLVAMHSSLTPAQRLKNWLAAHNGEARIVLGTRMAVFASLPHLQLIVVDEEHDPSYKQQEGARYSARDLAVYRGQLEGAKVILGSATPSLESWHHSRPATATESAGRYMRLAMPSRVGQSALPLVKRVDMNRQPYKTVFSNHLLDAMRERVTRGEQILVLLNRRGYAPV